jgi:hypothetical protein
MDGAERRDVRDALGTAFPSWGRFEELVDRVDRPLTRYAAAQTPLRDVVFAVVQSALAEGWLARLLEEAVRANPGNRQLVSVVNRYRVDGRPAVDGRPTTVVTGPPDVRTVISVLADEFSDLPEARTLVARAGLSPGRQPIWQVGSAELFWSEVHRQYAGGAVVGGWPKVLREAFLERPGNAVIRAAAAAAGVAHGAPAASPGPMPPMDGAAAATASPAGGADRASGAASAPPAGSGSAESAKAPGGSPAGTGSTPNGEWDFFISYTSADGRWAEWIAWELEAAGYSVYIQEWDFVPGTNWMDMMTRGIERSTRTVAVLSNAYLTSVWGKKEWQAALRRDPEGIKGKVIPVRVEDCDRPELLATVVSVDLFDMPEDETSGRLLAAVKAALGGRKKPTARPAFPPSAEDSTTAH